LGQLRGLFLDWKKKFNKIEQKVGSFNPWDERDGSSYFGDDTGLGWSSQLLENSRSQVSADGDGGISVVSIFPLAFRKYWMVSIELTLGISSKDNPFNSLRPDFIKPDGLAIRDDMGFTVFEIKGPKDDIDIAGPILQAVCGALAVFAKREMIESIARNSAGRRLPFPNCRIPADQPTIGIHVLTSKEKSGQPLETWNTAHTDLCEVILDVFPELSYIAYSEVTPSETKGFREISIDRYFDRAIHGQRHTRSGSRKPSSRTPSTDEGCGMELYKRIVSVTDDFKGLVLGTVVETAGSTPQKAGCQSLLDGGGVFLGTLGGGMVEDEAQRLMRAALADGQPRLFERRLDDDYSRTAGPICGGVMRIFVNPKAAASADAIRAALDAAATRRRGALLTEIGGSNGSLGEIQFLDAPRAAPSTQSILSIPSIAKLLSEERPGIAEVGEGRRVFVEPIVPAPRLLVVGGGHVGQAVAKQMIGLGFEVSVIDDREEFSRAELFPEGVETLRGNIGELVAAFPKDPDTYIVLVSKGHRPDAEALEACIHSEVAYLGMIGSRRKVRMLRQHFLDEHLASQAEWDRLVAPIGYDIGAVSVPEIAISIAAQLIAARRLPQAVRGIATKAL